MGVYAEILPPETPAESLKDVAGIILSGGPQSVYDEGSPNADPEIFNLGIPVMGLCYGLHWMTQTLGGKVSPGKVKEYGKTEIEIVGGGGEVLNIEKQKCIVWMSHGDEASELPPGFELIATSEACKNAAFADLNKNFYALQFHPEVTHSEYGEEMLKNFVDLCNADAWSMSGYKDRISQEILDKVGDRKVFMLVSGGVDSTVAFTLLNQVLGADRVQGLLVDHGLMRKGEVEYIRQAFEDLGMHNLRIEEASDEFMTNLQGVYEPEAKRKIIGDTFLAVQKRVSEEMNLRVEDGWMLGQGTIYPDTIETGATKHSDQIKTHHNRVEAVQQMIDAGLVIEPLEDLYKDEVRELGEELGLPHELVWRHPFPGPGLGVRILCVQENSQAPSAKSQIAASSSVLPVKSVGVQGDGRTYRNALALFSEDPCSIPAEHWDFATEIPNKNPEISRVLQCLSQSEIPDVILSPGYISPYRANLLREADAIVMEEMLNADLYSSVWQFPVVLIPCGIEEGSESIVLRPIESTDAMTANASHLPTEVLQKMTDRIMQIEDIDLVFLDLTNKPPGTIEWE